MKRIHPKIGCVTAIAALALASSAGGCRNPSGAVGNPFLAPSRVPPPATRQLMPGEAQPYYPGDPLPVMQSRAAQENDAAALASAESEMPSADTNLAWQQPGAASASPTSPASPPSPAIAATPAPRTVAGAEASVAIPADVDALRFALPAPVEPAPFAPMSASPLASAQPQPPVGAHAAAQGVVPASYSAPSPASAEAEASNLWRTPYAAQPVVTVPHVPQPAPQAATLALPAPPSTATHAVAASALNYPMDVRLRAVTSGPRIRLPGYDAAPQTATNSDGFRPRTSMK